jgi:hypothetical protein
MSEIKPVGASSAGAEAHGRQPGEPPLDWQKTPDQNDVPAEFRGKTFAEILALMMQEEAPKPPEPTQPVTTTEVHALHPVQLAILQALEGGTPPPTNVPNANEIAALYGKTIIRDSASPTENDQTQ